MAGYEVVLVSDAELGIIASDGGDVRTLPPITPLPTAPSGRLCNRRSAWGAAGVSVAVLGAAAIAAVAYLSLVPRTQSSPARELARPQRKAQLGAEGRGEPNGSCGLIEEGVEYHTRRSHFEVLHSETAEECCAQCEGDPRCGSWVWGQKRSVEGLSDACLLQSVEKNETPTKVKRQGIVSGLPSPNVKKHGVLAGLLRDGPENRTLEEILPNQTCRGNIHMVEYGSFAVVSAEWSAPDKRAGWVDTFSDSGVIPHLGARMHLEDSCNSSSTVDKHDSERPEYAAFGLLGKVLRYTTDVSGAGCGCNAALRLVPMRQNKKLSNCSDFYCDAAKTCGVPCAEIGVQSSNQYAWSSELHTSEDVHGISFGYGGGSSKLVGRRNWTANEYAPGAGCIDTSWPFEVAVSFPVDGQGSLVAVEVTLSQDGHSCPLGGRVDEYTFEGKDGLAELSGVLEMGVTPVISYTSSAHMAWLDGVGPDGGGPCVAEAPDVCPDSVKFYGFSVESIHKPARNSSQHREAKEAKGESGSPLDVAIYEIHKKIMDIDDEDMQFEVGHTMLVSDEAVESEWKEDQISFLMYDGEVMGKDGQEEWEVVFDHGMKVRESKSFSSKTIGTKPPGAVVTGHRDGKWVALSREPGYMAIMSGDLVLLEERTATYSKISNGTCADVGKFPIVDPQICVSAAFALGYFDTEAAATMDVPRPEGCHLVRGRLELSLNTENMGNGATKSHHLLCSTMDYMTTTTTTTSTTSTTTTWGWPSLFCYQLIRPDGYELSLVKSQVRHKVSIFACDEYEVYSNGAAADMGGWNSTEVEKQDMSLGKWGTEGTTTNSWLNTQVFIDTWNIIFRDGRFKKHDWTVKVDPDAVFFPARLRSVLEEHTPRAGEGESAYFLNCDAWDRLAMYGSMEIFSRRALQAYADHPESCNSGLQWHGWGEDYFMQKCMDKLGATGIQNMNMLADKRCHEAPCSDTSKVTFHDFKDEHKWFECFNQSAGA